MITALRLPGSILTFFILCLSAAGAYAQTTIRGNVKSNTDGKGMPGINVMAIDKKSAAVLRYGITDNNGDYLLSFKSPADSLLLTFSGFNIAKQSHTIGNRSQLLNFEVSPQPIKLKEIKINPPKIRRLNDTISYLVDGFVDPDDRTIGDVLKKMPGIEVKPDGSILYNNKPINKFYIENQDLLQGRYGIATNNIEARDVATVQVLENHQPVKALKNREFTDEAALNLKLKDNAKGVLIANAKVGAGLSPILWNNELFSMYFNKGRQNMNTYKGNNTGDDPGSDFNSYYKDGGKTNSGGLLSVQSPSAPAISRQRYLFNRAHAFSINNLWTTGKEKQLNFNMSYLNDRQDKSSFSRSTYYLPGDSIFSIQEKISSRESISQLDGSLQLNTNKDKYFLDNVLSFKGKWGQTAGIVAQADTVFQQLHSPQYAFANTLKLIRNYKKISLKISSYTAYTRSPQTLNVQPLLYDNLFSSSDDFNSMQQEVTQDRFTSNNELSFGLNSNSWKQNYAIGLNVNLQQFRSKLQGQMPTGVLGSEIDSLSNNLHWNKREVYFDPDYTYVFNDFRATASLPLSYNALYTNEQYTAQRKNINRLFFNPVFTLHYDLNLFLALSANAGYTHQLGEINDVYTGFIMQSYRSLVRNDGQLPEQQNQSCSIDLNYRNPLHAIFGNAGIRYFRNKTNLLFGYDYQGILQIKKTYEMPNVTSGYNFSTRISKGIDAIAGSITLEVNYFNTSSSQISQNQLIAFKSKTYLIKPGFYSKIQSWASVSYDFQLNRSKNKIYNATIPLRAISANNQHTRLSLFPAKGLTLNFTHEYFYANAIAAGNRTMHFADTGIKYKYKNMEFSAEYDNIFNAKQYISASYSEISTYYSAYDLRPAQVILGIRFKIK